MKRIAVLAAAIAIGCAVFAIPSVAHAQPVTGPLSFNSMTPADGASITSGAALTFEMSSSAGYVNGPSVEVSTQPTLGQDGTLADDFRVSIAAASSDEGEPGHRVAGSVRTNSPGSPRSACAIGPAAPAPIHGLSDRRSRQGLPRVVSARHRGARWRLRSAWLRR